jgi:hypothetical protein
VTWAERQTDLGKKFWAMYRGAKGLTPDQPFTSQEGMDVLRWLATPEGRDAAKQAMEEMDARDVRPRAP